MRSDHDIDKTARQIAQRLLLFRTRSESRHQIDPYRIILHSLYKCIVMLLREYRGWHEKRDLFPILHSLKCSSYSDFRLPVSDISADKAIHYLSALHVCLYGRYRIQLIIRFVERKHLFKFFLPFCIRTEFMSCSALSRRI
ncbi:MAG: hypothetical protein BWY61_02178 [Firmicutes bacterium ADurb.Bin354]|nr:MAG: hypothetical protein BWY61_02178 [Firmicutes bacterium ADurb.Bin354]